MKKQHPRLQQQAFNFTKGRIDEGILARWDKTIIAADKDKSSNSIDIFDVIGYDYWTGEGFTAKRMSAALRSIGAEKDVVVNINSPGGDFFEGAAIYNLLAEHKGHVTVNVIGLAASAASVIAMAGDTIRISQVGFLMVHNSWSLVVGNRHDLHQAAAALEAFDGSMRELYAGRTGLDPAEVEKLMDGESWINAQAAIDQGFAEEIINVKKADESEAKKQSKAQARRTIEMALANLGFSRKEREELFLKAGKRDAADPAERDAGEEENNAAWQELIDTLRR